jgi:hypothetical protein
MKDAIIKNKPSTRSVLIPGTCCVTMKVNKLITK